ncbi:MAG: site-specific recombinase [Burkholderiales bacterium]|nr:site-specific recombinase [Burkholderiales bacterium]
MTEVRTEDGLDGLLREIATAGSSDPALLVRVVDHVRPRDPNDAPQALKNLQALQFLLSSDAALRIGLRDYLLQLFASHQQVTLYADLGILPGAGFFSELWRRIAQTILPAAIDPTALKDALGMAFHRVTDHRWVNGIADEHWLRLLDTLGIDFFAVAKTNRTVVQLLDAAHILSARIAAMGVEPELAEVYPPLREYESPFLMQNVEAQRWVQEFRDGLGDGELPAEDEKQIRVLLDQCRDVIGRIRRNTGNTGISVALTYLLQRLTETIDRLDDLLDLLDRTPEADRRPAIVTLFKAFVEADNKRNNLREHFAKNTELLAREVTEHSGRTGEHYITATRKEYKAMLSSALGAGLIVPFMALLKIGLHGLHPAPLIQGLLSGLNYSLGFMLIHVLHFTVATKQPAMTASRIAAALDHPPGARPDVALMVELIVRVIRSQFIAVIGNVALAFPLAYVLASSLYLSTGTHVMSPEAAHETLHSLDPLASLALFHAAIAGVWLFMSGLIAGYHDNIAVYNRIPERVRQLKWLGRRIGPKRLDQLATYIEGNLGSLAGNFWFGMLLGLTATVGMNLGLPIDIRHITFSAANLATATVSLDQQIPWQTFAWCAAGVALVGIVNLTVSFSLALLVAFKARRVRFRYTRPLAAALWRRFLATPLDFVRPPREPSD